MPTKVHKIISSIRHRASNSCVYRSATYVYSGSTKHHQVDQRWIGQMFGWMSCDFIRIACSFLHSRHLPLCLKCLHNLRPIVSTIRIWKGHEGTCLLPSHATIFPHSLYKTYQKGMPSDSSSHPFGLCAKNSRRIFALQMCWAKQEGAERSEIES